MLSLGEGLVRDQTFKAGVSGFQPDDLKGLKLWLRPGVRIFQDLSASVPADSVGDPVALWEDQSGGDFDLSQGDSTARPVLQRRGDGTPFVKTDGTSQYLEQASSLTGGSQNRTLFIKGLSTDAVSNNPILNQGYSGFSGETFSLTNETGVRVGGGNRIWGNDPFTSRGVLSIILDGTGTLDLVAYLDGSLLTPTNSNAQSIDTASEWFWLGARADNAAGDVADYGAVEIESVLLYNRALPGDERQQVEEYLLV